MAPRPPTPIQAPQVETPQLSLLRTITPTDVADAEVGFTFYPEGCGQSGLGDPAPCPADPQNKPIPVNPEPVAVFPVYAWAGDRCSTFSVGERDWQARALRQLRSTLSFQVAHELLLGLQAEANADGNTDFVNDYLASAAAEVVTSAPIGAIDALAVLEQAGAECSKGPRVAIHAPPSVATHWLAWNSVIRVGNSLVTQLGNPVIVDAGYTGQGPGRIEPDDGSVWAYATGIPIIRQGPEKTVPDTFREALNTSNNSVEYRAERQFAVGWDQCCHLAAEINIPWGNPGS